MSFDDPNIEKTVRKEFGHLKSLYFNAAYFGPGPMRTLNWLSAALIQEMDPSFFGHDKWLCVSERVRKQMANILGVPSDRLTHSTSTSDIIATVANGYPFSKGDIVCSLDREYPSNVLPWMRAKQTRGIDFRLLNLEDDCILTPSWLAEHLPDKTKIFNVSYVSFETGKTFNLLSIGKYLKERGVLFILDATQAFGGMALSREEMYVVDIMAVSCYKWLLGPYGHAFGYFSPKASEVVECRNGNWLVTPKFSDMNYLLKYTTETLSGARKFDRGQTPNMLVMSCLEASLDFLKEIGLERIQKHNAQIRDYFLKHYPRDKYILVTPDGPSMGNIICLRSKRVEAQELVDRLKKHSIDVSIRQGNIRLSFHVFNTIDQVNTLLEVLDF